MTSNPRIVAIYKTWDGGEWVADSLKSVYPFVSSIVMVHSNRSWLGDHGNECRTPAVAWSKANDSMNKVHHVDLESECPVFQETQYSLALDYIRSNRIEYDYVMVVDSDELWEPRYLGNAVRWLSSRGDRRDAYQVSMHTYLKTPFYRVDPPYGQPVTFFKDPVWLTKSPRGNKAPTELIPDCWMHHMTYVRRTPDDVKRKIHQSCRADRGETVVPNWMDTVWRTLPHGENLHAFARWRHVWKRIERVWWADLPDQIRCSEMMNRFWPEVLLEGRWVSIMDGEKNTLYELSKGVDKAVDLGTFHGMSAVILSLGASHVHTFDVFENALDRSDDYGRLYFMHTNAFDVVRSRLSQFGNITVHMKDTVAAASMFDEGSVGLVFVDADHSYEGTRSNWTAWFDKLRSGGLLVFHDDNDLHPGVQKAIRELDSASRIVRRIGLGPYSGSLAAFRKV